jgi:hypothetical protein
MIWFVLFSRRFTSIKNLVYNKGETCARDGTDLNVDEEKGSFLASSLCSGGVSLPITERHELYHICRQQDKGKFLPKKKSDGSPPLSIYHLDK